MLNEQHPLVGAVVVFDHVRYSPTSYAYDRWLLLGKYEGRTITVHLWPEDKKKFSDEAVFTKTEAVVSFSASLRWEKRNGYRLDKVLGVDEDDDLPSYTASAQWITDIGGAVSVTKDSATEYTVLRDDSTITWTLLSDGRRQRVVETYGIKTTTTYSPKQTAAA